MIIWGSDSDINAVHRWIGWLWTARFLNGLIAAGILGVLIGNLLVRWGIV